MADLNKLSEHDAQVFRDFWLVNKKGRVIIKNDLAQLVGLKNLVNWCKMQFRGYLISKCLSKENKE